MPVPGRGARTSLWHLGLLLLPLSATAVQAQAPLLVPDAAGLSTQPAIPIAPLTGSSAERPLLALPSDGALLSTPSQWPAPAALPTQATPPTPAIRAAARSPVRLPPPRLLRPAAASRVLQAAVDAAVSRNPALQGASTRRMLAAAKRRSAAAFFPGAPVLSAADVSDEVIRNRNARDAEIALGTQIWLPGESTASLAVAEAETARLDAEEARQLLALAGEVRDTLAVVATAEADRRAAEARLRDSRLLEADETRRLAAREIPETELLVASADRIDAEAALAEKTAAVDVAVVDFRALTGINPNTAALNEPSPARPPPRQANPRLLEARRQVETAEANLRLAGVQTRERPEIGVVARRARDIQGTVFDNSLGFQLRVPFASETVNAPRRAAAEVAYNDALLQLAKLDRDLDAGEKRARIELASATMQRELAGKRADIFEKQRELLERSYAAGQSPLADLIRARTLAFQAEAGRERADAVARQARGRMNQALGLMP